jgi:hypothetical protein
MTSAYPQVSGAENNLYIITKIVPLNAKVDAVGLLASNLKGSASCPASSNKP